MRTAQTAAVRTQKQMDQRYIQNIARQIAGEFKITVETIRDHGHTPQAFSKHVFQDVLHRVARMNPQTLGRILAYGLAPNKGEEYNVNGHRITSMSEAWFGSVENTVTGIMFLEWSATAVVVAAIYDVFNSQFVARSIVNGVYRRNNLPPRYPKIVRAGS